jgi:RNA polymerase sigma-70 factor (ECF subfamily)
VGTVKTWLHRARLEVLDQLRSRGLVNHEATDPPPLRGDRP